jgi:hypothetical protein
MDIFGRKRIAELKKANANLNRRLGEWEDQWKERNAENIGLRNQVEYLVRTIRQTDDIIFSISQCTNWESMRPRVAQLTDQMTARKVAESNRVNQLVIEEIRSVYTEPQKRIGK